MTSPAAAACHALGGASTPKGIGILYLTLIAASAQIASIGLLVSGLSQSINSALRASYGIVLVIAVFSQVPYWMLRGTEGIATEAAEWLRCISPVPAVVEALGQSGVGASGIGVADQTAPRYLLFTTITILICAIATIIRLARAPLDRARPAGVITQDLPLVARLSRRLFFLVDPQRRSGGISWYMNPVMVKEFQTRRFGRSHWLLRLVAITAVSSLAIGYLAAGGALSWGIETVGGALVILQSVLLILFAPSLAAGLISAERESGSWTLLRTTPLSTGKILRGKLLSAAWPVLLLLCGTLPGYVVLMMVKPELSGYVERVVVSLAATAIFALLLSATASCLFRTTASATVAAYLAVVAIFVVPLLVWLGRDAPFGHRTVETALTISPLAAGLSAAQMPGFAAYQLIPANWWFVASACVVSLLLLWVQTRQLYRPE
jgi:ABC-type transport system involved in multi-copper enzyme maturation permease subunit